MNYQESLIAYERAIALTPGAAQTLSKMPARFPRGAFPAFLKRVLGAYAWDVDGNKYVDWIAGLASVGIGHNHPAILDAVIEQLADGISFSLPTTLEADVAVRLKALIPCAEMTRFVKTGSEATEAAIRTARIVTGRELILTPAGHYHSWHSWHAATRPEHPGVPKCYERLVKAFPYNDLAAMQDILVQYAGHVAAIILEPLTFQAPQEDYLKELISLAHSQGALVIFDEIVTGFRLQEHSAQACYNVEPDLACFGKALANGFPLACLVGRRDYMQQGAWTASGTFSGEAISLAAAQAALDIYATGNIEKRLEIIGQTLRGVMESQIAHFGLPARIEGLPFRLKLVWDSPSAIRLMSLWLQGVAAHGVLLHPGGWTGMAAISDDDLQRSASATRIAFTACAKALATQDWSDFKGSQIEPLELRR